MFYEILWPLMTTDDVLWRFMSKKQSDGNCHKMSQNVVKCRRLSWRLSQIVVTFYFCRSLPAVPFGFRRFNLSLPGLQPDFNRLPIGVWLESGLKTGWHPSRPTPFTRCRTLGKTWEQRFGKGMSAENFDGETYHGWGGSKAVFWGRDFMVCFLLPWVSTLPLCFSQRKLTKKKNIKIPRFSRELSGDENWTQTIFSQTFRAPPDMPAKIPGYPTTEFGFPGFRRTYRTFWPPHPTRRYPDQKVWVWVPFSSLMNGRNLFTELPFL